MKFKILGKVFMPIMVILLLVTGGGFYFAYDASKRSIEELLDAELGAISRLLARNIDTFSKTAERDVGTLSKMPSLQNFLAQPDAQENFEQIQKVLATFTKDYPYFETVLLADPKGRIIASSQASLLDVNIADRDYFIQALAGKIKFCEPVISRDTNSFILSMGYPVTVNNEVIAVLAATIPLKEFSETMVGGIRIAQTGYPIIISPSGIIIGHHNVEVS